MTGVCWDINEVEDKADRRRNENKGRLIGGAWEASR